MVVRKKFFIFFTLFSFLIGLTSCRAATGQNEISTNLEIKSFEIQSDISVEHESEKTFLPSSESIASANIPSSAPTTSDAKKPSTSRRVDEATSSAPTTSDVKKPQNANINTTELDYVTARCTTGFILETEQCSVYDETVNLMSGNQYGEFEEQPAMRTIRAGEVLDEKGVVFYAGTCFDNASNRSLYCSGEFRLSGVLRYRREDEMLVDLGAKGDLLFYPFPKDISDYPFRLCSNNRYSYQNIRDEKNNFYFFSDTIELLLGNTETKRVNTKIEFLFDEDRCPKIEYYSETEEYLTEDEYYYAEFVFSNLYLHFYPDRMTGHVYSSGDLQEIVYIKPMKLSAS